MGFLSRLLIPLPLYILHTFDFDLGLISRIPLQISSGYNSVASIRFFLCAPIHCGFVVFSYLLSFVSFSLSLFRSIVRYFSFVMPSAPIEKWDVHGNVAFHNAIPKGFLIFSGRLSLAQSMRTMTTCLESC